MKELETRVVDIDVDDHECDVVRGQPLKAFAVFQPVPARFFKKLKIASVVHMLINVEMKTAYFDFCLHSAIAFTVIVGREVITGMTSLSWQNFAAVQEIA